MKHDKSVISGRWYAVGAYGAWGFVPLYWTLMRQVPSAELLANRILWSLALASVLVFTSRRWPEVREILRDRRRAAGILACAVVLGVNWFTYLYAVNSGHIVDASLGYFITPFVNVFMGIVIFRERLSIRQAAAFILAAAGVVYMTVSFGRLPWIALILAASFGTYGMLKKKLAVDSILSLQVETLFLAPAAIAYLMVRFSGHNPFVIYPPGVLVLLPTAGIVTLVPLVWFARGVQRVPMTEIGMLQYIAPSLQLLSGVLVFGEPFTPVHAVTFGFIWAGLAVYSISQIVGSRRPPTSK